MPQINNNAQQSEYQKSITPPSKRRGAQQGTQNHLTFSEVRDGIVVMRDSSLRMVIMCSPTNYDLKSPREKDAIEFSFQGFLNTLHFPIQIIVQSRKIDLDNYLNSLDERLLEINNSLLASLMQDYIVNLRGLLREVNIMDKKFFVVVPYYVDEEKKQNIFQQISTTLSPMKDVTQTASQFENRKREILQRTNNITQGLASMGVRCAVLKTQEVMELLYSSYNLDESVHQSIGDPSGLNAPIVKRGGPPPKPYSGDPKETEPYDLYAIEKMKSVNNGNSGMGQ